MLYRMALDMKDQPLISRRAVDTRRAAISLNSPKKKIRFSEWNAEFRMKVCWGLLIMLSLVLRLVVKMVAIE